MLKTFGNTNKQNLRPAHCTGRPLRLPAAALLSARARGRRWLAVEQGAGNATGSREGVVQSVRGGGGGGAQAARARRCRGRCQVAPGREARLAVPAAALECTEQTRVTATGEGRERLELGTIGGQNWLESRVMSGYFF